MNANPNIGYTGTHANWSSSGRNDYLINNGGFKDLKNDISSELRQGEGSADDSDRQEGTPSTT